jgi:hypothetical protein
VGERSTVPAQARALWITAGVEVVMKCGKTELGSTRRASGTGAICAVGSPTVAGLPDSAVAVIAIAAAAAPTSPAKRGRR